MWKQQHYKDNLACCQFKYQKGGYGMNTSYKSKTKTSTDNNRSYFDWGCNMQVVRKGIREIAMTEGEFARFFGVT